MSERESTITINGKEYNLLLTTRATKEIANRFGGLAALGSKMDEQDFERNIDDSVWLVALLANQSIQRHNFEHPEDPKKEITVEEIELLTTPLEIGEFAPAIEEALKKGTKREIESNAVKN